jgi:hypothetical protein
MLVDNASYCSSFPSVIRKGSMLVWNLNDFKACFIHVLVDIGRNYGNSQHHRKFF